MNTDKIQIVFPKTSKYSDISKLEELINDYSTNYLHENEQIKIVDFSDEEKYLIVVLSINASDEDVDIILNDLLDDDYETKILID